MIYQDTAVRAPKRSERLVYWLAQHWLWVFNIAWGVFVVTPWLAPVFMKIGPVETICAANAPVLPIRTIVPARIVAGSLMSRPPRRG